MIRDLITIFERDLHKLKREVLSFQNQENLWKTAGNVSNSAGNLTLHLTGNLNHYICHVLGNTEYQRDRQAEFESKHIPSDKLISDIEQAGQLVLKTLQNLSEDELCKPYPEQVFGYEMTTSFFLFHLASHLNYHLGQINYIRRILDKS